MRMMVRNKSKFFYALYKEKVPKTDEYGNVTGEYEIIRDNPVELISLPPRVKQAPGSSEKAKAMTR